MWKFNSPLVSLLFSIPKENQACISFLHGPQQYPAPQVNHRTSLWHNQAPPPTPSMLLRCPWQFQWILLFFMYDHRSMVSWSLWFALHRGSYKVLQLNFRGFPIVVWTLSGWFLAFLVCTEAVAEAVKEFSPSIPCLNKVFQKQYSP